MQTLLPNSPALNEIIFHTALCARVALWVWVTQALIAPYRRPAWYDKTCYFIYAFVAFEILLNPIFNFLWLSTVVGLIVLFVPLIHLYVVKKTDDIPKQFRLILNVGFITTLILFLLMVGGIIFANEPNSQYPLYMARLTDLATPLILLGVIAYRNRLIHDELGEIKHALNEAKIRAEYESKLLSDRQTLIDMLAHELKNPLTSIGLAIDNLSSYSSPGEDAQKRIANINRSIRDMDEIIERCNLMNNLESKEIALERTTVLLDEFIHEIVTHLDADEGISSSHLKPISLTTDAKFLKVIFTNLIQNAIKYSKPKSTIKIEAIEKSGYISIFFRNEISTTMVPDESSIFERFYRHPLAQKHRGAGLGLYLTREICKLLGGHIAYSHQNGVVSFVVELPN
jgi:signal transduction histidine kinase